MKHYSHSFQPLDYLIFISTNFVFFPGYFNFLIIFHDIDIHIIINYSCSHSTSYLVFVTKYFNSTFTDYLTKLVIGTYIHIYWHFPFFFSLGFNLLCLFCCLLAAPCHLIVQTIKPIYSESSGFSIRGLIYHGKFRAMCRKCVPAATFGGVTILFQSLNIACYRMWVISEGHKNPSWVKILFLHNPTFWFYHICFHLMKYMHMGSLRLTAPPPS